jgi:hypothetical protein
MYKDLEVPVKSDLERQLAVINALPMTHTVLLPPAKWVHYSSRNCPHGLDQERGKNNVVGVIGYDLSSAFDTVAAEQLFPELQLLVIRGRELSWFTLYISGSWQCMVWNGVESTFVAVKCVCVCDRIFTG